MSIRGVTYDRLRLHVQDDQSISGFIEELINEKMDAAGQPIPDRVDPPRPRKDEEDPVVSQHFTF